MRKTILFLLSALVISSCASSKKQFQRGNYDAVINKSIKKLVKNPNSDVDAILLDKSYKLANDRDLERVRYLKMENNPNNWEEVFTIYETLKYRQSKVKKVLPLKLQGEIINYGIIDYDSEILKSKRNAAEYFYANGKKLLQNQDRESQRGAYYQLIKAQKYSDNSYPDLNELIIRAHSMGLSRVLVQVENSSRIPVSPGFKEELLAFKAQDLNTEWIEFHLRKLNEITEYDYFVIIRLLDIVVSPEDTRNIDKIYKKEVENGFDYAKDSRGNVMKDSAGNDIKIIRFKTLQCTLIETSQWKAVNVRGQVEIIELNPEKKLLIKELIGAENIFSNSSTRAIGDEGVLDAEARQMLKNQVIPYPDDIQMILNTAEILRPAIRSSIKNNRKYLY